MTGWPRLDKPEHGQPCNSCGLCCLREQCPLSLALFGESSVCPALRPEGDMLRCGLITDGATYARAPADWNDDLSGAFALLLGAGDGCDAGEADDETIRRIQEKARAEIAAAPGGAGMIARVMVGMAP